MWLKAEVMENRCVDRPSSPGAQPACPPGSLELIKLALEVIKLP